MSRYFLFIYSFIFIWGGGGWRGTVIPYATPLALRLRLCAVQSPLKSRASRSILCTNTSLVKAGVTVQLYVQLLTWQRSACSAQPVLCIKNHWRSWYKGGTVGAMAPPPLLIGEKKKRRRKGKGGKEKEKKKTGKGKRGKKTGGKRKTKKNKKRERKRSPETNSKGKGGKKVGNWSMPPYIN